MEDSKNKKIIRKTETLEEKIFRLEHEVAFETAVLKRKNIETNTIESELKSLETESKEIAEQTENEKNKLQENNRKIAEIEQQIKNLLNNTKQKETTKESPEETLNKDSEQKELENTNIIETGNKEIINPEKQIEENLEKALTPEETKIVSKEMETLIPESFEPKEVKKNKGLFLKNLITKSVSGMKFQIPENLKKIARRMRSTTLMSVAVLGLFAGTSQKDSSASYLIPKDNLDGSKNTVSVITQEEMETKTNKLYLDALNIKDYKQLTQIKEDLNIKDFKQLEKLTAIDTALYNKLTPNGRKCYLYGLTNINHTYYIADKPTAKMYAISPDGKEIGTCTFIRGTMLGEAPNTADVDESRLIGTTTPAGKYEIGDKYIHPDDIKTYKGKILSIYNTDCLAIHIVYPGEFETRMAAINTPTPNDNNMSWGCANVPESFYDACITPYVKHGETATLMITPDFQNTTTLSPKTGEITQTNTNNNENINYQLKI
jgi:hypothetical protein